MKFALAGIAVVVIGLAIWSIATADAATETPSTGGSVDNMSPAVLSKDLPVDVDTSNLPKDEDGNQFTFESLQPRFDRFSWETFVALNWPTGLDRIPTGKRIGEEPDNLTVWELWKEDYEIFLENGTPPDKWGADRRPPSSFSPAFKKMFDEKQAALRKTGKPLTVLEASVEPFDTGPLIDQNGKYARFEILVNEDMFNDIVNKKLYSKAGQEARGGHVIFTCGSKLGANPRIQGSIMIKASWKVLAPDEKAAGKFHTADCLVHTTESKVPKIEEHCELVTLGLVGFHIVHKTFTRPQWVWSTFEHVDNCPTLGKEADRPSYNFYSKFQYEGLLSQNSPPSPPWDPTVTEPPERRSQIKRIIDVGKDAQDQNGPFQKLLGKSVWANYQLISTQWPSKVANPQNCDPQTAIPGDLIGLPAPQFLGNSTLESYVPKRTVNVSSSCIECHANATATNGRFSDFTFLLLRAK